MDGLDEVSTDKLRYSVQSQLRGVAEKYPENRFILTCRTQVLESTPSGFTPVEVADFSEDQITQFIQNWFISNRASETESIRKLEIFNKAVSENNSIKDLASTPVLLSLLCMVLEQEGKIPTDKNWLYKRGIKLLLGKWNNEKDIQDWELGNSTYQALSIEEKENLLINIAARKFENPKNFVLFDQEEIANQISNHLNLNKHSEGSLVLKAIEAQHGLLIERADELWSFSHLTFQEYFTTQWLSRLEPEKLADKISSYRWR